MDRSRAEIGLVSRKHHKADHTGAWLVGLLLVIVALAVAVLMGDSIAFPVG